MNPFKFFLPFTLLLYVACGNVKQNTTMNHTSWFVAGETPEYHQQALGYAGPIVGVSNGIFVVIGGANFPEKMPWEGGAKKYYALYSAFKSDANGNLQLIHTDSLAQPMAYAATCNVPNGFVAAGGENQEGLLSAVKMFQWDTVKQELITSDLPHLPHAVTNGHLAYDNGILYFAGGENAAQVFNEVYQLNFKAGDTAWTQVSTLPQPTSSGVFLAHEGKLWLLGGRMKRHLQPSLFYNEVYSFDIQSHKWTSEPALPKGIAAGTGAVLGSKLFLFGGDQGETFNKTENLIFKIAQETNEVQKQKLIQEKANLQEQHPGFSHQVWCLDTQNQNASWTLTDSIPFASQVTTLAVPFQNFVYFANGEVRAGVRTPHITAVHTSHLLQH